MERLIFATAAFYTIIMVFSLVVFLFYLQKRLRLKKEVENKTNDNNKYLRCKIMLWTSAILLIIFSMVLILLIFINVN